MSVDIPRTIHVFWDGPEPPPAFLEYMDRWEDLHPKWTVIRWNHRRYAQAFAASSTIEYYMHPAKWSPLSNEWQWRSDLARYEILNSIGGVWVDADLEPLKPIDELLDLPHGGAIVARESDRWINNAFMGSAPGGTFIRDVLNGVPTRVKNGVRRRVNHSIGARYITAVASRHRNIRVLPRELIYPFSFDELHRRDHHFPGAYTKHHWNNRTTNGGRKK